MVESPARQSEREFHELFDGCYAELVDLAWWRTGNAAAAERVAQQAFVRLRPRWATVWAWEPPEQWVRREVARRLPAPAERRSGDPPGRSTDVAAAYVAVVDRARGRRRLRLRIVGGVAATVLLMGAAAIRGGADPAAVLPDGPVEMVAPQMPDGYIKHAADGFWQTRPLAAAEVRPVLARAGVGDPGLPATVRLTLVEGPGDFGLWLGSEQAPYALALERGSMDVGGGYADQTAPVDQPAAWRTRLGYERAGDRLWFWFVETDRAPVDGVRAADRARALWTTWEFGRAHGLPMPPAEGPG